MVEIRGVDRGSVGSIGCGVVRGCSGLVCVWVWYGWEWVCYGTGKGVVW